MNGETSHFFHRETFAEVNLAKIQFNFRALSGLLPDDAFVCPMIKANAYGHGDREVARALRQAGARRLGVNLLEEGIGLRQSGDTGELLTFALFDERGAEAVIEFSLTPVISDWYQLEALSRAIKKSSLVKSVAPKKIHLKFNTGMNRFGFAIDDSKKLRRWIEEHSVGIAGICTHLLRGDDAGAEKGESENQFLRFRKAVDVFADLKPEIHALNSSAMINLASRAKSAKTLGSGSIWPVGARPGIGIYGVAPSNDEGVDLHLQPALSLKSHLATVRQVPRGEGVSYGATWRAKRDSTIGIVPIGYADGFMRLLSNKAPVLCRGRRVPVTGVVCMDATMIDLTDIVSATGAVAPGEEVVLLGEQGLEKITAQELANLVGTIPYEILTSLSARVPRVYR